MKIEEMVKRVNTLVGSGRHRFADLEGYFDECIDDINEALYIQLPLISSVYKADVDLTEQEIADGVTFEVESIENEYTRIPDAYIRNYICYEVAYRRLRDEDEPQEVFATKYAHASRWFRKLVAEFSNASLADTEAIIVNGDYDELVKDRTSRDSEDDTGIGYYNPLWEDDA